METVYRTRFTELVRVCEAITGSRDSALDAVQEGFARALRSQASYSGAGSIEGWVWRIVVNQARDQRRARPRVPDVGPVTVDDDSDPEAVRALIARLPERQRLVLFLRYYADLDYAAIATVLEIAPGTVAATLSAAHKTLKLLIREGSL